MTHAKRETVHFNTSFPNEILGLAFLIDWLEKEMTALTQTLKSIMLSTFILLAISANSEARTIKVCLEHWEPWYYLDEDNIPKGKAIALLEQVFNTLEVEAEYLIVPYQRCMHETRRDHYDAVMTVSPGEEGVHVVPVPLAYWQINGVVHEDSDLDALPPLDKLEHRPLFIAGYTYPDILRELTERSDAIHFSSDFNEGVPRIFRTLADRGNLICFIDGLWARNAIERYDLPLKILKPSVFIEPNMIGFSPKNKELAEAVTAVFAEMGLGPDKGVENW